WNQSPSTGTATARRSRSSARTLVSTSSARTAPAVTQKRRRSAAGGILFLLLARDAEPRVGQRVQALEADVLAAGLAPAELLRAAVEPAERLVHVPQVAPLLRGHQELLLALHGVGALVRHVERVGGEVAVGGLQGGVEGLVVVAELLHHARPLLEQPLFHVRQLLL